jgi:bone morphogenetic protein 2/4
MQIRAYQVLDEQQLGRPDIHRLLGIHVAGAHSHGWEVFNVTEAVLDWLAGRRPNKGILVTCNTIFEQSVQVRFARRNEHHNSKQPILVLFDDEAKTRGHTTAPITEPRPGKKIVSFLLLGMYTNMFYGFAYGKL